MDILLYGITKSKQSVLWQAWLYTFYLALLSGCILAWAILGNSELVQDHSSVVPWVLQAHITLLWICSRELREPKAALSWAEDGKGRSRDFRSDMKWYEWNGRRSYNHGTLDAVQMVPDPGWLNPWFTSTKKKVYPGRNRRGGWLSSSFLYIILPVPLWAYYLYPCHGKSHQITSQSKREKEERSDKKTMARHRNMEKLSWNPGCSSPWYGVWVSVCMINVPKKKRERKKKSQKLETDEE